MPAGYSGTPLAKKLSLKDGMRVWWDGVPDSVSGEIYDGLEQHGAAIELLPRPEAPIDAAHVFVTGAESLKRSSTSCCPCSPSPVSLGSAGPRRRPRCLPTLPKTRSARWRSRWASST